MFTLASILTASQPEVVQSIGILEQKQLPEPKLVRD